MVFILISLLYRIHCHISERVGIRIDITNKYRAGFIGVVITQTATTKCELLVKPQNNIYLSDFVV